MRLPSLLWVSSLPIFYVSQIHLFHSMQDPWGQLVARQEQYYTVLPI